MTRIMGVTILLATSLTGIAAAQGIVAGPAGGDRAAVAAMVRSAVTEEKLCRLAIEKSANPDVQTFCRKASGDFAHTAIAGMALAQMLHAPDVKLEPAPGTPELLETLGSFSGQAFDREFLLVQIADHENDEHTIRYAQEFATDSSVKHYETTVLPKVETDLTLAESALLTVSEAAP